MYGVGEEGNQSIRTVTRCDRGSEGVPNSRSKGDTVTEPLCDDDRGKRRDTVKGREVATKDFSEGLFDERRLKRRVPTKTSLGLTPTSIPVRYSELPGSHNEGRGGRTQIKSHNTGLSTTTGRSIISHKLRPFSPLLWFSVLFSVLETVSKTGNLSFPMT